MTIERSGYLVKSCHTTRNATIEIASAKISVIVIAVRIFGAAEGLRPSALMLDEPAAAITNAGARMQIAKIIVNATFLLIANKKAHPKRNGLSLTATPRFCWQLRYPPNGSEDRKLCARPFQIVCPVQQASPKNGTPRQPYARLVKLYLPAREIVNSHRPTLPGAVRMSQLIACDRPRGGVALAQR